MRKFKLTTLLLSCVLFALPLFGGCMATTPEVDEDTLQIAIVNKGFGSSFVYALGEAYEKKTGTKVAVTIDSSSDSSVREAAKVPRSGVDILFDVWPQFYNNLSDKNYISGYDIPYADISDVYNSPADPAYKEVQANPDLKIKDIINAQVVEHFTYQDGKQYAASWIMDVNGLLYHKTIWERDKAKLGNPSLPKTTNEMFALFDKIKSASGGKAPYAFKYGGQQDEMYVFLLDFLAQYEGMEFMENMYAGKNADGVYTPEIFRNDTVGRRPALEAVRNIILKSNGYVDAGDSAKHMFVSQVDFLEGMAYFSPNGSWLDREASTNFKPGEADVAFMKMPILSAVVNKFPEVFTGTATQKDEQLSQVISYIDGDTQTKPAVLDGHDDALEYLTEARKIETSQSMNHPVSIMAYSPRITQAKDFLKFMFSKEGQEVMMKSSYGNMLPLNVDPTQFDYYNSSEITELCKSKLDMFSDCTLVVHNSDKYPLAYRGGYQYDSPQSTLEVAFGGSNPQSVDEYITSYFNRMNINWNTWMGLAGLSNQ